jgi:hypothetical protein
MKYSILLLFTVFFVCSCSSTPKEEPFSVDLNSPRFKAGSVEVYLDNFLSIGNLKKNDVTVYYYPLEDAVCLQFNVMYVHCNQFWDRDGRDAFVKAFERYQEEYEQRKLIKKGNRKTRQMYGTVQGFFTWKKTSIGIQAHGYPKIKLGYQFEGQSVFFTTTQLESYYEDPQGHSRNQTSQITVLYFTRAQAEELTVLFKQEYLRSLGSPPGTGNSDKSEIDKY